MERPKFRISVPLLFIVPVLLHVMNFVGFSLICSFHADIAFLNSVEYGTVSFALWHGMLDTMLLGMLVRLYLIDNSTGEDAGHVSKAQPQVLLTVAVAIIVSSTITPVILGSIVGVLSPDGTDLMKIFMLYFSQRIPLQLLDLTFFFMGMRLAVFMRRPIPTTA